MDHLATTEIEGIVDRAWFQIETAVHTAVRSAGSEPESATLISLALMSRLAGFALREIIGTHGRTTIAELAGVDHEDALWCLEAVANLRCEDILQRASATLTLKRSLS